MSIESREDHRESEAGGNNNPSQGIIITAEEKARVIKVANKIDLFMSGRLVNYTGPFIAYDDLPEVFWDIVYFMTRIIAEEEDVMFRGYYKDGRLFYSFADDSGTGNITNVNLEEDDDEDDYEGEEK